MDKDDVIKALMVAMLVMLTWSIVARMIIPPPPTTTNNNASTTTAPAVPETTDAAVPTSPMVANEASEEQLIDIGAAQGFPITLQLSSRGAAIVSAELNHYAEELDSPQRYRMLQPVKLPDGRDTYSYLTEKINIDDQLDVVLAGLNWNTNVKSTPQAEIVEFSLDLAKPEQPPSVRITKTFTISKQADKHSDIQIQLHLRNLTDQTARYKLSQNGPVGVRREDYRSDYRRVTAGLRSDQNTSLRFYDHGNLNPLEPELLYTAQEDEGTLSWVAVANKFFAVITSPEQTQQSGAWIAEADALRFMPDDGRSSLDHVDTTFQLVTEAASVEPGGSASRVLNCYMGPKAKTLFQEDPSYSALDFSALVNNDYYFCAWTPIVDTMLWLLTLCYGVWPNYGLAIIVMVLIVRVLLHPLTKKAQINMTKMAKQMQTVAPKLEEIREKFKNDAQKQNEEVMKLYQEHGINPAGQMLSCLPMFFQMPIWGALWAALNFTVEMRHQPFYLWIEDLTSPDAIYEFANAYHIPLLSGMIGPVDSINVLPPLLGIGIWLQQKYMPKPASATRKDGKSADQMAQQAMFVKLMMVFMAVAFYNAPSGLTLYIMASNFFGLFEQMRIRKHLNEEEEREKNTPKHLQEQGKATTIKKPRFLEKLEKMAEEAHKEARAGAGGKSKGKRKKK